MNNESVLRAFAATLSSLSSSDRTASIFSPLEYIVGTSAQDVQARTNLVTNWTQACKSVLEADSGTQRYAPTFAYGDAPRTPDEPKVGSPAGTTAAMLPEMLKRHVETLYKLHNDTPTKLISICSNIELALGKNAKALLQQRSTYTDARKEGDPHVMLLEIQSLFESTTPSDDDDQRIIDNSKNVFAGGQLPDETTAATADRLRRALRQAVKGGLLMQKKITPSIEARLFIEWLHPSYASFVERLHNSMALSARKFNNIEEVLAALTAMHAPTMPTTTKSGQLELGMFGAASANPGSDVPPANKTRCTLCRLLEGIAEPAPHWASGCPYGSAADKALAKKRHEDLTRKRLLDKKGRNGAKAQQGGGKPSKADAAKPTHKAMAATTDKTDSSDDAEAKGTEVEALRKQVEEQARVMTAMRQKCNEFGLCFSAIEQKGVPTETVLGMQTVCWGDTIPCFLDSGATCSTQGGMVSAEDLTRMKEPVSILGLGGHVKATHATESVLPGIAALHLPGQEISLQSLGQATERNFFIASDFEGRYKVLIPRTGLNLAGEKGHLFVRHERMFPYAAAFQFIGEQLTWIDRDERLMSVLPANDTFKRRMTDDLRDHWELAKTYVSDADPTPNVVTTGQFKFGDCYPATTLLQDARDATSIRPPPPDPTKVHAPAGKTPVLPMTAASTRAVNAGTSVEESVQHHTPAELCRSRLARLAARTLLCSSGKLDDMMKNGRLPDMQFSRPDISRAGEVFGDDPVLLTSGHKSLPPHTAKDSDGHPTRTRLFPSHEPGTVSIGDALSSDMVEIAGAQILASKVDIMGVWLLAPLSNESGPELADKLSDQVNLMKAKCVDIRTLHCDQGPNFMSKHVKEMLTELNIERMPVAKSAHVVAAEALMRPSREALLALLVRIATRWTVEAPPKEWFPALLLHFQNMHCCTLDAREGDEFTPGQKFHGRNPTQRELTWEPGTLAMAKVPAGVYPSKDAEKSEPVVYLACLMSSTSTALVWNLNQKKVMIREINELRALKIFAAAQREVLSLYEQNVRDGKALKIPNAPFEEFADDIDASEVNTALDKLKP
jgi:hypothetical protein